MQITRIDVLWNYAATFLKIASSALLLPFILRMMPAEMVGIWTVFVTYIFSGVRSLKTTGFETIAERNQSIDYGLLKGVISAMRWFYSRMAVVLFLLLTTAGTWYIFSLMKNYKGEQSEVYIAWGLLCIINSYNIFTLYYNSLLLGKGLIKKSKQIIIVGNLIYLIIAASLMMAGKGLIAIVTAKISSVIIIRWLSYRAFFSKQLKQQLKDVLPRAKAEILKAIYPNAIKIGLTTLGGFMVTRSAVIIGSFYLSLEDIASYGITMQLIGVIAGLSSIFTATYQPKIVQLRVENNITKIKILYLKGQLIIITTYVLSGSVILVFGDSVLQFLGSNTMLMPSVLIALGLILSLEQTNLSVAGAILVTKNEVPFFKAALYSGAIIIIGLFLSFHLFHWGLLTMLIIPLLVDVSYQAWKWPLEVVKELKIK